MQNNNLKFKIFSTLRCCFSLSAFRFKFNRGFTLIEMMIAVTLFSVVMVTSIGALLSMIDANRKAQTMRTVMDNLNFAVENITRKMRVGFNYHCGSVGTLTDPRDCPGGDTFIAFRDSSNTLIIFRLNNGSIEKSGDGGATYLGLTAPEITIDDFRFFVTGSLNTDTLQPKVLMIVRGTAGINSKIQTEFSLQTTASQRFFDG